MRAAGRTANKINRRDQGQEPGKELADAHARGLPGFGSDCNRFIAACVQAVAF
jgi:hypothetical protein